ncbi:hypothetical protein LJC42_08315, partial [Eubacteriales bacterium OttesenSCG-928-K08]|nr:hypothetical protein [Eubacteriales bacterium OttesenSCG-928-K08]
MSTIASIQSFLNTWLSSEGTIGAGDTEKLSQFLTALGTEVDQLSVQSANNNNDLILYSGYYDDIPMWKFAEGASQSGQDYYYISNTEAGMFLEDSGIRRSILSICDSDENLLSLIYDGERIDGVRSAYSVDGQRSLNDRVSYNLAQNASGNVTVFAPSGNLNSVLSDTELRAILANDAITSINGVGKDFFLDIYNQHAGIVDFPSGAPEALNQNSLDAVYEYIRGMIDADAFDDAIIHYSNSASVVGVDTSNISFIGGTQYVPENSVLDVRLGDLNRFPSGSEMEAILPDFDSYSDLQKLIALNTQFEVNRLTQILGAPGTNTVSLENYLNVTGKGFNDLDSLDTLLIQAANSLTNGNANAFDSFADVAVRLGKLSDLAENVLPWVDRAFMAIETICVISSAVQAYNDGDKDLAAGIIVGKTIELVVANAGGWAINLLIAPYLVGFGAAVGGPIGALLGGIVAGAISYGLTSYVGRKLYEDVVRVFMNAGSVTSPIVLDLNGNGYDLLSLANGTYFDLDNEGGTEKTGWVQGTDGLLVLDRNEDRIINNGGELFGDNTILANGQKAISGFQALAELDSNQDGVIDENDDAYFLLKVWQDHDSNGQSGAGELKTLAELGIVAIHVNPEIVSIEHETGARLAEIATFEWEDGTFGNMGDFYFRTDTLDTSDDHLQVEISDDILLLPNVRAIGNTLSLHKAMALDKSGVLQGLVEEFMIAPGLLEREALLTQILFALTDAVNVDPNSRGTAIDACVLVAVEQLMGQSFNNATTGSNPGVNAAKMLKETFQSFKDLYLFELLNVINRDYISFIGVNENQNLFIDALLLMLDIDLIADPQAAQQKIAEMHWYLEYLSEKGYSGLEQYKNHFLDKSYSYMELFAENSRYSLFGTEGYDILNATEDKLYLIGNDGNDRLTGNDENNLLYGGDGDDMLYGGNGNDVLDGGAGDDYLEGGWGHDTYVFGLGYGTDTIFNYRDNNYTTPSSHTLKFLEGVSPEDLVFIKDGNNLVIQVGSAGDKVVVQDHFLYDYRQMNAYEFADGTVWTRNDVNQFVMTIIGTGGNDVLTGSSRNPNEMYGGDGNDILNGGKYNDTLYGGDGNDT